MGCSKEINPYKIGKSTRYNKVNEGKVYCYSKTCQTATLKKTGNWFSRPIIAKCSWKVLGSILHYFRPS